VSMFTGFKLVMIRDWWRAFVNSVMNPYGILRKENFGQLSDYHLLKKECSVELVMTNAAANFRCAPLVCSRHCALAKNTGLLAVKSPCLAYCD
jgi:hypothetical protein